MKFFGILLAGFLLGALSVRFFGEQKKVLTHKEWAKEGLQKIETKESDAEKLKAAEVYYGKAVVLFLASLGNRLNTLQPKGTLVDPIIKELPPSESITENEQAELAVITKSDPIDMSGTAPIAVKPEEKAIAQLVQFQRSIVASRMSGAVRRMNGHFEGTLQYEGKRKGRVDQVMMDFNFYMKEKQLEGDVYITMTDPEGKTYSRSTGAGKNKTLRLINGKKDQVYVEPSPGSFMLLDISKARQLTGRYFNSRGDFVGRIQLFRK